MIHRAFHCGVLLAAFVAGDAMAGLLVSPSVRWVNFSFRPDVNQNAVNYYGLGGGFTAGYSVSQMFDVAGVMQYAQGRANAAIKPAANDCTLTFYGAELAARLTKTIYMAFRGGTTTRTLDTQTLDTETTGSWSGYGFGASIGGIVPGATKSSFAQVSLSAMSGPEMRCNTTCPKNWALQRLDMVSVDLAWVFNEKESAR